MPPSIIAHLPGMDKAAIAQVEKNATEKLVSGKPAMQADAASVLSAIEAERKRRVQAVLDGEATNSASVWASWKDASLHDQCVAALTALPPSPAERAALTAIAEHPGLTVAQLGKLLGKKTMNLTVGTFCSNRRHFFSDPAEPRLREGTMVFVDLILDEEGCAAEPAMWTLKPGALSALRATRRLAEPAA